MTSGIPSVKTSSSGACHSIRPRLAGAVSLAILTGVVLAGCATGGNQKAPVSDTTAQQRQGQKPQDDGTPGSGLADQYNVDGNRLDSNAKPAPVMPSERIVYFDFDSSVVKPGFAQAIRENARYLAGNPGVSVALEGHTDERGSREYNIGLSERRARAVRAIMLIDGVRDSQIQLVGYGEEYPAATGHDEAAWSRNRRVQFHYSTAPQPDTKTSTQR